MDRGRRGARYLRQVLNVLDSVGLQQCFRTLGRARHIMSKRRHAEGGVSKLARGNQAVDSATLS
jgi:hypothetical protein